METLVFVLACLGVFAAGMIARSALVVLVLTVAAVPVVAFGAGMRAAEAHGLRRKGA